MTDAGAPGSTSFPEQVRFDAKTGLAPAIVQAASDGTVLMLGYMNRTALERTLSSGRVTFYSRSRQQLWEKGETSGNWLEALEIRSDCDADALLVRARPRGPACHTGARGCFDAGVAAVPEADPGSARSDGSGRTPHDLGDALEALQEVIEARDRHRPAGSHTATLLTEGVSAARRKVGEEALEVVLAAENEPGHLAEESADLLYHLMVLWRAAGLDPGAVGRVLARRRVPPGGEQP